MGQGILFISGRSSTGVCTEHSVKTFLNIPLGRVVRKGTDFVRHITARSKVDFFVSAASRLQRIP
jgi:hypothetical protein